MSGQSDHTLVLLLLIPLLPMIGAVFNGLFGARLQNRFRAGVVHWPAVGFVLLSFLITAILFVKLMDMPRHMRVLYFNAWSWLDIGQLKVNIAFWLDPLSAVMALVVTFVGMLIHVYSIGYMKGDPGYWRFFSYLNLFMSAMLILVLGDNFLMMFIGWEGVGLCSYLLIGYWYKDRNNAAAGMKAFIVNRIGDFGFVIGVFLLFWGLGGLSVPADPSVPAEFICEAGTAGSTLIFHEIDRLLSIDTMRAVFVKKEIGGVSLVTLICICLFIGAIGKSAQIPLYVWLPDAMAGPTPVSALIHAATMVTAGVYMVARLHFLYTLSTAAMTIVALFGAVTALFAATIGFFQYDIKKVLAYSTISQLGYMFIGVGVGAFSAGIFHLMTHAFFKGCLFLCAGSVIIGCHHEQDMRRLGGLKGYMPITRWMYLAACAAIAGMPFFSGFFSKDEILWRAYNSGDMLLPGGGKFIWLLGIIGALCTSYYMFRSYFMSFTGQYRGDQRHVPEETSHAMTYVLLVLGFLSIIAGFIGLPHIWHLPNLFAKWIDPVFESTAVRISSAGYGTGVEWGMMGISITMALLGAMLAKCLYQDEKSAIPEKLLDSTNVVVRCIHRLVYNKYYIDEIYQKTIVRMVMHIRLLLNWFDEIVVDGLVNWTGVIGRLFGRAAGAADDKGVDGMVNAGADAVILSGRRLTRIQTGRLRTYVGIAVSGLFILVILNYLF